MSDELTPATSNPITNNTGFDLTITFNNNSTQTIPSNQEATVSGTNNIKSVTVDGTRYSHQHNVFVNKDAYTATVDNVPEVVFHDDSSEQSDVKFTTSGA